jgi:hypothetical protein
VFRVQGSVKLTLMKISSLTWVQRSGFRVWSLGQIDALIEISSWT